MFTCCKRTVLPSNPDGLLVLERPSSSSAPCLEESRCRIASRTTSCPQTPILSIFRFDVVPAALLPQSDTDSYCSTQFVALPAFLL
ncbi:hypothetical protein VTI28DRAFT_6781 [Corynascus sepedonium]